MLSGKFSWPRPRTGAFALWSAGATLPLWLGSGTCHTARGSPSALRSQSAVQAGALHISVPPTHSAVNLCRTVLGWSASASGGHGQASCLWHPDGSVFLMNPELGVFLIWAPNALLFGRCAVTDGGAEVLTRLSFCNSRVRIFYLSHGGEFIICAYDASYADMEDCLCCDSMTISPRETGTRSVCY